MSLRDQLKARLKEAMKARDSVTANSIRMVNTRVMERCKSGKEEIEPTDELVLEVITAYRKSLQKGIGQYEGAGDAGAEAVKELQFEIDLWAEYLPAGLSEDELRAAVKAAIAEAGATDPKQAGRIVGAVMKQHKGRVEAADVKRIAGEELGG